MKTRVDFDFHALIEEVVGYPDRLTVQEREAHARRLRSALFSLDAGGDEAARQYIADVVERHCSKEIRDHVRRSQTAVLVNIETGKATPTSRFLGIPDLEEDGQHAHMVQMQIWYTWSVDKYLQALRRIDQKHSVMGEKLASMHQIANIIEASGAPKDVSVKEALELAGYHVEDFDIGEVV